MSYGYVYCMTNVCFPNLCKIGCVNSGKTSHSRALSLSTASVPLPYVVQFDIKVNNPHKYEKILHTILKPFHFKKEFFKCKSDDIIKYFNYEKMYEYDKTINIKDFADNYLTIYNKPNVDISVNDIERTNDETNDIFIQMETPPDIQCDPNTMLDIVNETEYNCVFCDKCYETYNSLYAHYRSKHYDEYRNRRNEMLEQSKLNKCNICNMKLNSKSSRYRHMAKCKEQINILHQRKINTIQNIKKESDLNIKIDKIIDLITALYNVKI